MRRGKVSTPNTLKGGDLKVKKKRVVIVISVLLILAGIGLLAYPRLTDLKYQMVRSQLGISSIADADMHEIDAVDVPDEAVCVLIIPEIQLKTHVLSGTSDDVLAKGPGHFEETALPGKEGNSAIAGHRNMYGSPFKDLDKLKDGDEIFVFIHEGKSVYQVTDKRIIDPTDSSVLEQSEGPLLTLITCQRQGGALNRLVVVA